MAPAELGVKPEPETVTVVEPCAWSPVDGVTVTLGVAALACPARLRAPTPESPMTAATANTPRAKLLYAFVCPPRCRPRLVRRLESDLTPVPVQIKWHAKSHERSRQARWVLRHGCPDLRAAGAHAGESTERAGSAPSDRCRAEFYPESDRPASLFREATAGRTSSSPFAYPTIILITARAGTEHLSPCPP